jgi:hypothetical protein
VVDVFLHPPPPVNISSKNTPPIISNGIIVELPKIPEKMSRIPFGFGSASAAKYCAVLAMPSSASFFAASASPNSSALRIRPTKPVRTCSDAGVGVGQICFKKKKPSVSSKIIVGSLANICLSISNNESQFIGASSGNQS